VSLVSLLLSLASLQTFLSFAERAENTGKPRETQGDHRDTGPPSVVPSDAGRSK
jgi:hypothetical protein